jgi:phosphate transport system substrate-binding protein
MKRLIGLNIAVALAASFAVIGAAEARTRLSGAGASFPSKIYSRWFADFAKEGGHRVNYQAVGSGSGRKAVLDETVDFGASDDPMKQGDMDKSKRGIVQIPMTGGTIAFGYNMPGCDLKLTQEQAVQVAIGEINNWSQVGCDDQKMTWVYRSDGSGTTAAFSNSMQAFSKKWKLGVGKSIPWPVGIGNKGNAGVAGSIRTTVGSIGYVNQSYIKGEVVAAALQNKNGEYVKPSVEAGALSLNGITLDENLAGTDPNPEAEGAYPIATLTWVLAYETGNGKKTDAVKETLSTLLSDEYQEKASVLGYVPLRGDILEKSRQAVERIGK